MFFFKIQVHCSHYYFSFFMHWFCSISIGTVNFDMPLTVHCRYRRFPDHHEFVDDLFCHSDDVEDMDISPYDECILLFPLVGVHIILFLIIIISCARSDGWKISHYHIYKVSSP